MENNIFNTNMENQLEEEIVDIRTPEQVQANRVRKRIVVVAAILCMLAVLATGTIAYFTAEETAYNVITTGTLDMTLHDETTGGKPFPSPEEGGIGGVMPGMDVDKVVYVENTGDVTFYTRIKLDKAIESASGKTLNFNNITLDIDTENWIKEGDFYYYKKPVAPGAKTTKLFTKVSFDEDLGNDYQNAKIEIDVIAQSVQWKNNSEEDVLEAKGWPPVED